MLILPIGDLQPGSHSLTLTPSAENLDLDPALFRDLSVEVTLDVQERQSLVRYDARALARLECDRTAVLFDEPVRGHHALLVVYSDEEAERQGGADDDVVVLGADGSLDIAESVRDTLLLALPTRRVAPQAEDAEIETQYGALTDESGNAIDPRWEALRKLRDDGS